MICFIAVDGGWSEWSRFSECSQTCKGGVKSRTRSCNNPAPLNGGSPCPGDYFETLECYTEIDCKSNKSDSKINRTANTTISYLGPVHGRWTKWSDWSTCTRDCGTGNQTRERSCTNPAPAYNGRDCRGKNVTTQQCNSYSCEGK